MKFLSSKKFIVTILSLTAVIALVVYGVSTEEIIAVTSLAGAYNVGQGIADHGKGKAEVEHEQSKI